MRINLTLPVFTALLLSGLCGASSLDILYADLDGNGIAEKIRFVQNPQEVTVTVENATGPQRLVFAIDSARQDAICGLPAELDTAAPDCRPEALGGSPLPGCKADAKAQALVLSDGRCDAIHLYWNHDTNALAWWRM